MIRLSDLQLGYIAGLIDGKGSIGITSFQKKNGRYQFQVRVSIHNCNKDVMNYIMSVIGCGHVNHRDRSMGLKNWKDSYTWSVTCQNAFELLGIVKDHLIIKKRQAEVAIEMQKTFLDIKENQFGCNGLPNSFIEKRMSLKSLMHDLNRKGRSTTDKVANSEKPLLCSEVTPNQAEGTIPLACVETNVQPPKGMI
jgi:hypothetical protein